MNERESEDKTEYIYIFKKKKKERKEAQISDWGWSNFEQVLRNHWFDPQQSQYFSITSLTSQFQPFYLPISLHSCWKLEQWKPILNSFMSHILTEQLYTSYQLNKIF